MTDPVPSKDEVWSDARIVDELGDYDPSLSRRHCEQIFTNAHRLVQRLREDCRRWENAHKILLAENERLKRERDQYLDWHVNGRRNVGDIPGGIRICYGHHEKHEECRWVEFRAAPEPAAVPLWAAVDARSLRAIAVYQDVDDNEILSQIANRLETMGTAQPPRAG